MKAQGACAHRPADRKLSKPGVDCDVRVGGAEGAFLVKMERINCIRGPA